VEENGRRKARGGMIVPVSGGIGTTADSTRHGVSDD